MTPQEKKLLFSDVQVATWPTEKSTFEKRNILFTSKEEKVPISRQRLVHIVTIKSRQLNIFPGSRSVQYTVPIVQLFLIPALKNGLKDHRVKEIILKKRNSRSAFTL
jgi:hypothetical protein